MCLTSHRFAVCIACLRTCNAPPDHRTSCEQVLRVRCVRVLGLHAYLKNVWCCCPCPTHECRNCRSNYLWSALCDYNLRIACPGECAFDFCFCHISQIVGTILPPTHAGYKARTDCHDGIDYAFAWLDAVRPDVVTDS